MSMQAWVGSTVQECCEIVRGVSFPSTSKAFSPTPGTIACLRTTNVQKEIEWEDLWFIPRTFVRRDEQILKPLDILISLANSYELVGKVALVRDTPTQATLGAFISAIRCDEELSPKFVYYQLSSLEKQSALRKLASTTTNISNISTAKLANLSLFVAPRREQERLVAKIEELLSDLDAGVAALERARANLKRYRAAVLKAAVEGKLTAEWRKAHPNVEPASKLLERILAERRRKWEEAQLARLRVRNARGLAKYAVAGKIPPKGWKDKYPEPAKPDNSALPELPEAWCWVTIEQLNVAERPISYGVLQPGDKFPDGVPLIRVCDVVDGRIEASQLKRIDPRISDQYQRTVVRGGEVLLTVVGTIGRTAVVPSSLKGANTARAVAVIAVAPEIEARYLELNLREPSMRARLTKAAHEVARKTLNLEDVRPACIPLAPMKEQVEIITAVEERFAGADHAEMELEQSIARCSRLRQSILKRAFEGKLVPQDANDEPASVLLERIRAARASQNPPRARKRRQAPA